ncbi:MAG: FAD-dependent oxidoreductase, partial [Lachnospiraceae bacterium]|nr:FAD-dependent oxidoreductase [Lachnospiraceae bacterium]
MEQFDLIIIGSGPAGLSAGIYASRAGLNAVVLEKAGVSGGQVLTTYEVDNYPALPGISGFDLGMQMKEHAEKLGAVIRDASVLSIKPGGKGENHTVVCEEGEFEAKGVIIATGAHHAILQVPGEAEFQGMGVSYCATCDGAFFRKKDVAVVGGGSAGFAAAWSAATLGSSVALVEKESVLGGTSTIGGVNNWEPVWGATGVPRRVYERLVERPGRAGVYEFVQHCSWTKKGERRFPGGLLRVNPDLPYDRTLRRHGPGMGNEAWFRENCHGVIFEPEAMERTMLAMLQETGRCRVLFSAVFHDVVRTGLAA